VFNFFVATSGGPVNEGPLKPNLPTSPTLLTVKVPDTLPLGRGFVAVQVVNKDQALRPPIWPPGAFRDQRTDGSQCLVAGAEGI